MAGLVGRSRRFVVLLGVGAAVGVAALVGFLVVAGADDDGDGGGDGVRTVQPGAPGETGRELSDDEVADIESPAVIPADVTFMQNMIHHHRQALDMAALVAERSERDDLPLLAERITVSQTQDIEWMEEWLGAEDVEVLDPADHEGHLMPGMATDEQLGELEQARGDSFDRLFLDLMITHHQGAVTMVGDLYEAGGGLDPTVDGFTREVDADQNIEIGRMQDLLDSLP